MDRAETLNRAIECVTKDRAADHGDMESNFDAIARYWTIHLGVAVDANDVGVMMSLLKIARIKSNRAHKDNYVDGAGYLACAAECVIGEKDG